MAGEHHRTRTIKSHYTWRVPPSMFNTEMCEKALAYVNGGYREVGDAVPSKSGLAVHLDISRPTLYKWGRENADFQEILDRLSTRQERELINGGLTEDFSANITKMLLQPHGYSDLATNVHVGADGSVLKDGTIKVEFVDSVERAVDGSVIPPERIGVDGGV